MRVTRVSSITSDIMWSGRSGSEQVFQVCLSIRRAHLVDKAVAGDDAEAVEVREVRRTHELARVSGAS